MDTDEETGNANSREYFLGLTMNYKNCQSCGMPFSRDEKGGGTKADGTKSQKYCSHCFVAGKFTIPDITAEKMKERVKGKLKEHGIPSFLAWVFTRNIPKLERWKESA